MKTGSGDRGAGCPGCAFLPGTPGTEGKLPIFRNLHSLRAGQILSDKYQKTFRLSPSSKSLFEFLRLPYALGPIEPRTKHTRMKVRLLKPIEDLRIPSVE
jgi:hypothetical protein